MYSPLQSSRLYEQVVGQIEQLITEGKLSPGDRLPSERLLSEQFNVSRTVVREAIKALREKGLVEIRPGKGTFIVDSMSDVMRQSIGLMVRIDHLNGLENLIQVRSIIEPEIAAIAAQKATPDDIKQLECYIGAMDEAMQDNDAVAYIAADQGFHDVLARATQNDLLFRLIGTIVDLLREQRERTFRRGGANRGQRYHKRLLETVQQKNSAAARQAMIEHLEQIRVDSGIGQAGK